MNLSNVCATIESKNLIIEHTADKTVVRIVAGSSIILDSLKYGVATHIEYHLEPNSHCTIISFDNKQDELHETFFCAQDSQLTYVSSFFSAPHAKRSITVLLQGKSAQAKIRGIYALDGEQRIDIATRQEHQAPHTTSDLNFRGILSGSARADYQGTIYVHKQAQGVQALQDNKNLLLSAHARANSVPSLEVLANNVSCKHGSAMGQLDALQLFYLQSRGIEDRAARLLLIQGFLAEVLLDMPIDGAAFLASIDSKISL